MADNQDETHPVREGPGPDSRGLEPGIIFMIILFSLFGFFILSPVLLYIYKHGVSATKERARLLSEWFNKRRSKRQIPDEERPPPYVPPAEADIRALMRPHVRPERRRGEGVSDDGFEEVELSVATTEGDSIKTESTAPPPYTSRPHSIQTMVD